MSNTLESDKTAARDIVVDVLSPYVSNIIILDGSGFKAIRNEVFLAYAAMAEPSSVHTAADAVQMRKNLIEKLGQELPRHIQNCGEEKITEIADTLVRKTREAARMEATLRRGGQPSFNAGFAL